MNYFRTAEEAAARLGVRLLHRAEADFRSVVRHDRLAAYAVDPVQSAHAWGRVREELWRTGSGDRFVWLTGPHGGLEQLPWAVGIAEQLARSGDPVLLAGPELPSLLPAHPGARSRQIPSAVLGRLAGLVGDDHVAVSTDLEGVRVAAPHRAPMPAPEGGFDAGTSHVLWVQSLPEELGTRLPRPDSFCGVVFVASFRDHTPFELEACVRQLRTSGHQLLGMVAIGPEHAREAPPASEPESRRPRRPSSIWDDSVPARGEERPLRERGQVTVRGDDSERVSAAVPMPSRVTSSEPGPNPGAVTETSWAHLAVGAPARSSPRGVPVPGEAARRMLDRLAPQEPDRGSRRTGSDDQVRRRSDAEGTVDAGGRAPAVSVSSDGGGTTGSAATAPGGGADTTALPLTTGSAATAPGGGADTTALPLTTGSAATAPGGGADTTALPGAGTAAMAATGVPTKDRSGGGAGREEDRSRWGAADAGRTAERPLPEDVDGRATDGPERTAPQVEVPAAVAEARTVPLIGLWERERRRSGASRVFRTVASVLALLAAGGLLYWLGTGHSLGELRELIPGGASAPSTSRNEATGARSDPRTRAVEPSLAPEGDPAPEPPGPPPGGLGAAATPSGSDGTPRSGSAEAARIPHPAEGEGSVDPARPGSTPPEDSEASQGAEPGADAREAFERVSGGTIQASIVGRPVLPDPATVGRWGEWHERADGDPTAHLPATEPKGADAGAGAVGTVGEMGEAPPRDPEVEDPETLATDATEAWPLVEPSAEAAPAPGLTSASGTDGAVAAAAGPSGSAPRGSDPTAPDSTEPNSAAPDRPDSTGGTPDVGVEETGWVVHLSSFKREAEAKVDIARFEERGVAARAVLVEVPERGPWYRVVAGSFGSFVEARRRALELAQQLGLETVHVIGGGGAGAPVPIPVPSGQEPSSGGAAPPSDASSGEDRAQDPEIQESLR